MPSILEYVWMDAVGGMRSKTRVAPVDGCDLMHDVAAYAEQWQWSFDGSSTGQATGTDSDVILRPVAVYPSPFYKHHPPGVRPYLVLCETYDKDGATPHATNTRVNCAQTEAACLTEEPLFGIEQEYMLFDRRTSDRGEVPHQWVTLREPGCGGSGPYYCGVGGDRCFGRNIVDEHLQACLHAGIAICGTNAEVTASQWEFQIGPLPATQVSDQLWMARYILLRITEEHGCSATFHPKPLRMWNGSGGHTNFSTAAMRSPAIRADAMSAIMDACDKLQASHAEHMAVYGEFNEQRMTGMHETSCMDECTWGVGDRGRSIRIPRHVANQEHGYLEDRRPAANLDPYLVTERIMRTCCLPTEPLGQST